MSTDETINRLTQLRDIKSGKPISDHDAILLREHFLRHAIEPYTKDHRFFFEEFQPGTIVAEYNGSGFQLQFGGKQEGIDCRLRKSGVETRLEMTFAVDGQNEKIKWEHFKKCGHLSVFQAVKYRGNERNRSIKEQLDYKATSWDETRRIICKLVVNAIREKIEKAPSRPLYNGAILVVTINDYKFPISTVHQRFSPIFSCASAQFSSISPFENFLGVCWSGKCIFDRNQAIKNCSGLRGTCRC